MVKEGVGPPMISVNETAEDERFFEHYGTHTRNNSNTHHEEGIR